MKVALIVLAGAIGAFALLLSAGQAHHRRTSARLVDTIVQHALSAAAPSSTRFSDLGGLPPPVVRYFRFALRDGQPPIRVARLRQTGQLRTDERKDRWSSFEAEHTVTPGAPGFVWDARVRVMPLLHISVRDAYVQGVGSGEIALLSAITLSRDDGGDELNAGELYRYLAEAPWFPTALLPGSGVRWTAIDERRASATLTHATVTAAIEYRFEPNGEISSVYAASRARRSGTEYIPTPWEGHHGQYVERDGMHVPSKSDVGWYVDGRWAPVWRARVSASYQFQSP